jgi:hypothetical protein
LDYDEADYQKNIVELSERQKRNLIFQEDHIQKLFVKKNDEFVFKK